MAIKNRRGAYVDYVASKLQPGEFAVVQNGDDNTTDGSSLYIATRAGNVKRVPFADEVHDYDEQARQASETAQQAAQTANQAVSTAQSTMDAVDQKASQIQQMTTNAEQIATNALSTAGNAENHMAALDSQMARIQAEIGNISIDPDDLGLEQDPDTYYVYPTYKGVRSENGIPLASSGGGGGGGGETIKAVLTVDNTTGWLSRTVADGADCNISLRWSSIEDGMPTGDGNVRITVNEIVRASYQVSQGNVQINLKPFINTGTNKVKVRIADTYDQGRTITYNITVITLSISSSFDPTAVYSSPIQFRYTPVGSVEKVVYFILDGRQIGTQVTQLSGREVSYTIPAQSHGGHSLLVYFESNVNGETVRSNELFFEFRYAVPLNNTVIITSQFNKTQQQQYATISIPYQVYDPTSLTAEVQILVNDGPMSTLTVDRSEQVFTYRAVQYGSLKISFISGETRKDINITVTESQIDVEAETEGLELHLTSQGRSNNEEHPEEWVSTAKDRIEATLSGFNWASDGWQNDEDGITCLRVSGNARVEIPYNAFASDVRQTGFTIEVEFSTRNVADYNATVLSCFSGNRGFKITPQVVTLKSDSTELSMQYKEAEHIRVAYTVDKRSENRLVKGFIEGTIARGTQYPTDDDFMQVTPVGISIGSSGCTIDIYCIRVYKNNLTMQQVLDNWIADTQDGSLMLERYSRNSIYDAYGKVVMGQLPADLPYFILSCPELPQYKDDKKIISGQYVDPMYPSKSFTFSGMQINVQGTSSAPYYRKNFDMQFKQGFELASGHADKYKLKDNSIPTNRFVTKADVASSEAANNTQGVQIFNDINPYKTPEMLEDARVRWGIDGFPILIFWNNTDTGETTFHGKYNFNFPKRFPDGYGYSGNDESWEFQNNTSNLMLFLTDYFDETMYTDPETGDTKELWRYDYEARFPSDSWTDYSKLQILQSFVYSTYRANATNANLPQSVTYEGVTYTKDTADYRLAKFRADFPKYGELDSFIFYYIFTELFLMVDSRAKNLFIGFHGSNSPITGLGRKAVAEPYDMDTQMGINNEGTLTNPYYLEDTDTIDGANVYNGQNSVLWNNIRDAFDVEIRRMYQTLRSGGLNYNMVETRFENAQHKWPEAIWNEDAYVKYFEPLINPQGGKEPTDFYLPMCQGNKEQQRKSWLSNRFAYMDSKWNAGDALVQVIQLRGYAKSDITVTPYIDLYPTVKYGSYVVSERGKAGVPKLLPCPLDEVNDTEIYIYSARNIASAGDLSGLKVGVADFSYATNIQEVKLGNASNSYDNPNMKSVNFGNNKLLKKIDVRNCSGLGTKEQKTVDISGCEIIEEVYFEGTSIQGLTLPNGGVLRKLHVPATMTNLTIMNQKNLTEFTIPSYSNLTTLRLENVPVLNTKAILNSIPAGTRVRLIGFAWEAANATEIETLLNRLDTMRGLDESGNNMETAQVSGSIHTSELTGAQIASYNSRYPYLTITADSVTSTLTFKTWDGSSTVSTVTCHNGVMQGNAPAVPSRTATAQYTFTAVGWNKNQDASQHDPNALLNVWGDTTVYAAYDRIVKTYTVTWKNSDNTTLETDTNVPYGTTPTYNGSTPTYDGQTSTGWNPPVAPITGDTTFTAIYKPMYTATFVRADIDGGGTLYTVRCVEGSTPVYGGETPTSEQGTAQELEFDGWSPALAPIHGNTIYTAMFLDNRSKVVQYLSGTIREYESNTNDTLCEGAFYTRNNLLRVKTVALRIPDRCFYSCKNLKTVDLASTTGLINTDSYSFFNCISLETLIIRSSTRATIGASSYINSTMLSRRDGAIYVPSELVSSYKSYSMTTPYIIASIDDYPLPNYDTINDTWEQIESNGGANVVVGDQKTMNIGNVGYLFECVGKGVDELTSGSGNANTTWVIKDIYEYRAINDGTLSSGEGYDKTTLKAHLVNDVLPLMEKRNLFKEVKKTSLLVGGSTGLTNEKIWLLSAREVSGGTSYEDSGCSYSSMRWIRYYNNSTAHWWLRSAYSSGSYRCVSSTASITEFGHSASGIGVVFGFCL